ncbi:MAG: PfkB family carbohydrate kinase [Myxococcota bacterium]|jgi:D-beta-D-heptose 7-phosphate kinase/D-beta-D-heptose 1-phosphate adenosyltransferase|nr:PfkB family carbohydrate kinase [Myxococcota bacterium]
MPKLDTRRLERVLEDFGKVRLLVVGDVVLDEYLRGDAERVSPEAPVPVVHVQRESVVLGGAGNVVRNVVALEAACDFVSVVGHDADGDRVCELLRDLAVDPAGVIRAEGRPTTRKTRVVARGQQIVRVDRETQQPIDSGAVKRLLVELEARLATNDGVVLEDYGKGLLVPAAIRKIMAACAAARVPVSVDPKSELRPFKGAALLKPNLREAETLAGVRGGASGSDGALDRVARKLRGAVGEGDIVITRGGAGMTIFEGSGAKTERTDVATPNQEVFDVQGAGDTTIAVLALARAAGASLLEAAVLANAAAGVVVEKAGTATATCDEIAERLPRTLAAAREGMR